MTRDPVVNISHKKAPTFAQHRRFITSRPYAFWYMILMGKHKAGAIYLARNNEVGIFLGKNFQGLGIGTEAIRLLMWKHPRKRYLANIAPNNWNSRFFFSTLGFKYIQATYEYEPN